jgi:hypothetical protein
MPIKPAPLKARPTILADWVELSVLANSSYPFRFATLKRYRDTHRETEHSDSEGNQKREDDTDFDGISGGDDDIFIDAIIEEIADRERILGEAYPFEFDDTGYKLKLKQNLTEGSYIYLLCLFLSNPKANDIFDGSWLPNINDHVRDLFQICSTLAAAGEAVGCAISFGWPRPYDNPPFLEKLRQIYALMGEGELVAEPRPGTSPSPKDAEIDVIAWTPTPDNAAGKFYLLGQVASGGNWRGKSMIAAAKKFHDNWFTRQPASTVNPSIFIPHDIKADSDASRRDILHAETPQFGTIFDRLRLPKIAYDGIKLSRERVDLVIERKEEVHQIISWVNTQLVALQAYQAHSLC